MGWSEILIVVLVVCIAVSWWARRAARPSVVIPVPRPPLDAATIRTVTELVAQDDRLEAIKLLREKTGMGLRELKTWVDAWDPGAAAVGPPAAVAPRADQSVLDELAIGARAVRSASGDIPAVTYVREQTGWGLADAKAYVDRLA